MCVEPHDRTCFSARRRPNAGFFNLSCAASPPIYLYPIIGKYASSSLGISSPAIGTHFFPNPGGLGGIASPPSPVPVCRPAPMKLCPVGSFSRTVLSVGTEEAATARSALPTEAMDEELVGTSVVVVGDGSEARVGEERRRVDRWDWVM